MCAQLTSAEYPERRTSLSPTSLGKTITSERVLSRSKRNPPSFPPTETSPPLNPVHPPLRTSPSPPVPPCPCLPPRTTTLHSLSPLPPAPLARLHHPRRTSKLHPTMPPLVRRTDFLRSPLSVDRWANRATYAISPSKGTLARIRITLLLRVGRTVYHYSCFLPFATAWCLARFLRTLNDSATNVQTSTTLFSFSLFLQHFGIFLSLLTARPLFKHRIPPRRLVESSTSLIPRTIVQLGNISNANRPLFHPPFLATLEPQILLPNTRYVLSSSLLC